MKKMALLAAAMILAGISPAGEMKLAESGIRVRNGEIDFVIPYPGIVSGGKQFKGKPVLNDGQAVIDYGEGRLVTCTPEKEGLVYRQTGCDGVNFRIDATLPVSWGGKIRWEAVGVRKLLGGAASGVFPPKKGAAGGLFDGICNGIAFQTGGDRVALKMFSHYWLKDDRVFNWERFAVVGDLKFTKGVARIAVEFGLPQPESPSAAAAAPRAEQVLALTGQGLAIAFGPFQTTLRYPLYRYGSSDPLRPAATASADGRSALVRYGREQTIDCRLEGDTLIMKYSPELRKLENPAMEMRILQDFTDNGGCWDFANPAGDAQGRAQSPFPREKAEKWYSFAGVADSCRIAVADGKGDALTLKTRARYYMKDERLWNKFWFTVTCFPVLRDGESRIQVLSAKGSADALVLDRFGQFAKLDFPDKVHREEELIADKAADEQYYSSFPKLNRTFWGGLPGSRETFDLSATGFFHLEKVEKLGGRTVLVDPEGNLYFHLGMSGITPGNEVTCVAGRENIYAELPEKSGKLEPAWMAGGKAVSFYLANYIRKFGEYRPAEWQKRMVGRCRSWGFNSFGVFMRIFDGNDRLGFAVTQCLERYAKRKPFHLVCESFIDPFDPYNIPLLEQDFAEQTKAFLGNPVLVGYYTENERSYNIVLPALLNMDREIPAKRVFADRMRKRYGGDIAAFNTAWKTAFSSFDDVAAKPMKAAATGRAEADSAAFEELFFDAYYKLLSSTLKKADPDHLYLGERLLIAQTYHEAAVKAMGKYCDVFSVNYYTDEYDPAEIERFARISGRPLMLSEWSFGSPGQGLYGCRNKPDDEERGKAYSRYVENAAASPYVIGVQWMNLLDESNTGRGFTTTNGERFNMGFLNVCDRPFRKLASHAAVSNAKVYDLMLRKGQPVPVQGSQASHAESRTLGIGRVKPGFGVDALRTKYPGRPGEEINRSVAGRNPRKEDRADMICGWDKDYLYILLTVADDTPASNTHKQARWMGDCVEVFVGADSAASGKMKPADRQLSIRVNTDSRPDFRWDCNGGEIETAAPSLTRVKVAPNRRSYSMEIAFPWKAVGITPKVGTRFRFDVAINFSGKKNNEQANKLMWNGLEEDYFRRDLWGSAVLEE